jgi:hypothetical protein
MTVWPQILFQNDTYITPSMSVMAKNDVLAIIDVKVNNLELHESQIRGDFMK